MTNDQRVAHASGGIDEDTDVDEISHLQPLATSVG